MTNLKKAVNIFVIIAFFVYCLALVKVMFLDGRVTFSEETVQGYYKLSNLIPFKTFYDYYIRVSQDSINISTVVYNLVGNFIVLFPLGCFLPCLIRFFRNFLHTLFFTLGIVCIIELLQPLFRIGFFDVDDLILNTAGACLGFLIVHIPFVNRILRKIHIYQE